MKTSIFDMNFVLPPMVLMTEVKKDIPGGSSHPSSRMKTSICLGHHC